MRYRRPKERRTNVTSAQKVSQSLGILPWNVPLAQMGQVPFPSSHLDFKGSVTEQIRQQQGDGKAAEMAVGDLIWMWPSFRPRCNGAMCSQLALPLPTPPLPSPPLHTCQHTLTHLHSTHTSPTYHFHFLKNNRFHFFLWSWFAPSFPLVIFFFLWWFKKTRQRTGPTVTDSSTNYNPKCLKRTHKSLLNLMQQSDRLWEGLLWGMSTGLFHSGLKAVERHL